MSDALLTSSGGWQSSPLSLVPSKATNPDALNTLATVFHGPNRDIVFGSASNGSSTEPGLEKEAALARALYHHYLSHNPRFWQDIVSHVCDQPPSHGPLSSLSSVLRHRR